MLTEKEKIKLYPIVEYLKKHESITRDTVQELCGNVGKTTTVKYLNRLCEISVLHKDDSVKVTTYYLKK